MFCPNCGTEFSKDANFCMKCGTKRPQSQPEPVATQVQDQDKSQENVGANKAGQETGQRPQQRRVDGKSVASLTSSISTTSSSGQTQDASYSDSRSSSQPRGLIKLLLIIGMACFIFPFATVSCGDVTASVSGLEAMTSLTMQDNLDVYVSDRAPNLFLIIAFVLGIVAVYKTRAKSIKGTAATATVGSVCLLLFRTSFVSYYDLGDYINLVTLEFRWGWILSILTYAVAAVLSWLHHLQEKNVTGQVVHTETVSSSRTPPPQEPSTAPPYEEANTEEDKEE